MESYNKNLQPKEAKTDKSRASSGRVWTGIIVIAVGAVWLAREAGADIPRWVTSWPMFLIAVGLFIGAKSSFRNWAWLLPAGVGTIFLLDRFLYFNFDVREFIFPAVIIIIGIVILFRRKSSTSDSNWTGFEFNKGPVESTASSDSSTPNSSTSYTGPIGEEDVIDIVSVFGSAKKNILSKNFKGGEIVNFFGGTELNLHQADIHGPVLLDMTQVFGGAKLVVPSNWRIQSELVSVFGGVDDKRMLQPNIDQTKVLVLKGTNIFGGLEIRSY